MNKKYIVRLSKKEREELADVVKKLKGSSQKVRRAQILLKADVRGPNWTDAKIAEAFSCRVQTVENLRKRLVTEGFRIALDGKPCETPPRQKCLDGKQEAKVIAMRLGKPPKGYANWSLRLLADHVVELGLVESISHETIRRTLKKNRHDTAKDSILGDSAGGRPRIHRLDGGNPRHVRRTLQSGLSAALHGRAARSTSQGDSQVDSGDKAPCQTC